MLGSVVLFENSSYVLHVKQAFLSFKEPDRQYQFWVTAVTNAGEGLSSNVVTQTPSARGNNSLKGTFINDVVQLRVWGFTLF